MISFIKIEHCTHGDMLSAFGEKHFINIELLEKSSQIINDHHRIYKKSLLMSENDLILIHRTHFDP